MAPIKRPPRVRRRTYLREWRQYRRLTLQQVGATIGWDHASLQRLETGKTPYNQDYLELLAGVYMCDPWDLISRDPNADRETASGLARQIAAAPASVQRQIKAVVATMLKT